MLKLQDTRLYCAIWTDARRSINYCVVRLNQVLNYLQLQTQRFEVCNEKIKEVKTIPHIINFSLSLTFMRRNLTIAQPC